MRASPGLLSGKHRKEPVIADKNVHQSYGVQIMIALGSLKSGQRTQIINVEHWKRVKCRNDAASSMTSDYPNKRGDDGRRNQCRH